MIQYYFIFFINHTLCVRMQQWDIPLLTQPLCMG